MRAIEDIIKETERRRAHDAERYAAHDPDLCMLCHAYGADKRSLFVACGYAVYEAVPEAISLHACPNEVLRNRGYYLLLCKSCRSRLLGHMQQWRDECVALRGQPKDHDGHIEDDDPERNIPVRVNGAVVMMTTEEYAHFKSGSIGSE